MTYMRDYRGEGYTPLDQDDPPERLPLDFGPPTHDEFERDVDTWLAEHYDDGANFGGEA